MVSTWTDEEIDEEEALNAADELHWRICQDMLEQEEEAVYVNGCVDSFTESDR